MKQLKWYQSSNFWLAAIMVVAGSIVGFSEEIARELVGSIFGIIALGKSLHELLKEAEIDWKAWIGGSNFRNYALIIITSFFATFQPEILDRLQALFNSIISGDVQGILVAIFSLATIIYNIFANRNKPSVVTVQTKR